MLLTACDSSAKPNLNFDAFQPCVVDEGSQKDLYAIKEYLVNTGATKIPDGWAQRFCRYSNSQTFEYLTSTESITGAPILIRQVDINNDGYVLVPHSLIIGMTRKPQFEISSFKKNTTDQFNSWHGECVPFLFERESEKKWIDAVSRGKFEKVVYYIAALCRRDKIHFKYFRYEHPKWLEIEPNEFPKQLALENLWYYQSAGVQYAKNTPKFIQDGIKESNDVFVRERLKIKPENYWFYNGLTGRMWAHLESGIDFWQFDNYFSDDAAKKHAVDYQKKYLSN